MLNGTKIIMYRNKRTVKFGILGLGRVVEKRVYSVFANEITNAKVVAVFDKDKKKIKNLARYLTVKLQPL